MAIKALYLVVFLLGIHDLNAQSFTLNWENEQAVSATFSVSNFKGIKLPESNTYLQGKLLRSNDEITFYPLVPFSLNKTYELWGRNGKLFDFIIQREVTQAQIIDFYPKGILVPTNFLKFYIEFNVPMGDVHPYQKIHLIKNGAEIRNAILPLSPPLWNEERTVLTVWLEPGRIKTGLGPNEKLGEILRASDTIHIEIESLQAQNGSEVNSTFKKTLTIVERDESKPTIEDWETNSPQANSKDKLVMKASEPMDFLSTFEGISILSQDVIQDGRFSFENDSTISFSPENVWQAGNYQIRVNAKAEDLAGNNFNRLFEEDISHAKDKVLTDFKFTSFSIQDLIENK